MIIEATIYEYLNSVLDVPAYTERPNGSSVPFVLFEKTGSSKHNGVITCMVAFQSVSDSMYNAALLNERVKEAVEDMPNHTEISGTHLNSDYNFSNLNTNEYRYQAVFNITYVNGGLNG